MGSAFKKICVEFCLYLCAAELKHEGIINATCEEKALVWREYGRDEIIASVRCLCQQAGSDYELALSYRTREEEEQDMSYRIAITHETRFIGKKVPVFLCPLSADQQESSIFRMLPSISGAELAMTWHTDRVRHRTSTTGGM